MSSIYTQALALAARHGITVDRAQRAVIAKVAAQRAPTKRERMRLEQRAAWLLTPARGAA